MATYFQEHREKILSELFDWLRIPTISADPEFAGEMQQGSEWLADHLRSIGLENVKIIPTSEGDSPPVVYGDYLGSGDTSPTVLMYGHYDVQPPDPFNEWISAPFDPEIRDGKVFARGSDDNKGQHFILLKALESLIQSNSPMPNIKVFFEGEEEIGGVHLEQFIMNNRDFLQADMCLIADTPMLSSTQPSIITGLRGLVYMEIGVQIAKTDMHSGHYGGNVLNPNQVLANILSALKDEFGKVLIPGFYDDVKVWSAEERARINEVVMQETEIFEHTGATVLSGEEEYTPIERAGIRPTLDINGVWGGFRGEGSKTVIPRSAGAKVSMRMVAYQNPDLIEQAFTDYVRSLAPRGCDVSVKTHSKTPAIVIDPSSSYFRSATEALTEVFGVLPKFVMEGGSIPVGGHIKEYLGIDTVYMGFGLPDDNLHAPNEKIDIEMIDKGIESVRMYLSKLTVVQ